VKELNAVRITNDSSLIGSGNIKAPAVSGLAHSQAGA